MARVVGKEPEVRQALDLPPLDANVIPLPPPELVAEDVYEETILRSRMPADMKRTHLDWYRREGRAILAGKGIVARRLDRARTGD